jgi:hypothetical protein
LRLRTCRVRPEVGGWFEEVSGWSVCTRRQCELLWAKAGPESGCELSTN